MCSFKINRLSIGVLVGMLLAACNISAAAQPRFPLVSSTEGLHPAPRWVRQRIVNVPDLYFSSNSHVLSSSERRKFAEIAPALHGLLHDFPDLIIVIEGFSDDSFGAEYNDQLALERAGAVRQLLLEFSFPESCFRIVSFGFRAPQCAAPDEVCLEQYRRVHFRAAVATSNTSANKP